MLFRRKLNWDDFKINNYYYFRDQINSILNSTKGINDKILKVNELLRNYSKSEGVHYCKFLIKDLKYYYHSKKCNKSTKYILSKMRGK